MAEVPEAAPPAAEPEAPPATEPTADELRERLAALGRATAEERERARRLEAELAQTRAALQQTHATLGQLQASMTQQEWARWYAELEKLPPEEQAKQIAQAALRLSFQQQQAATLAQPVAPVATPATAPAPVGETPEAYTRRRVQEIVETANLVYGLSGEQALTPEAVDDLLRHPQLGRSEETFRDAVMARAMERGTMARKPKTAAKPAVPDDTREEIKRAVLQELGVGQAPTPQPAAPPPADVPSPERVRELAAQPINLRGPRANIAALRAAKEAALRARRG
jgi:hypothetical protein